MAGSGRGNGVVEFPAAQDGSMNSFQMPRLSHAHASMRSLDGSTWAAGLAVEAFGVHVGVRVDDAGVLSDLHDYLPRGATVLSDPCPVVQRLFSLRTGRAGEAPALFENGRKVGSATGIWELLRDFEKVAKMFVARHSRAFIFLHAGALEWEDRAIVIPGDSFLGKTTLVAALVRRGARFYSDEYSVLDTAGNVHPFPQPLGIREPGDPVQRRHPIESFGGTVGERPVPVGLVLFTGFQEGVQWSPEPLSRAVAIQQILPSVRGFRGKPAKVLDVLERAMADASILTGPRGDADEAAVQILDYVSAGRSPT